MTTPPIILALVTDAFGGRGGIAQYNRDVLSALAAGGAAAVTTLPRHIVDEVDTPPTIRQLPARPGRLAYAIAALIAAIQCHPSLVFCGHLYMSPLAWVIARLCGAKLAVQMHGIEAWPRPSRLQRIAVENADLVLCVSRDTRASVLGWAAIAPERLTVIPNTVADAFAPGDSIAPQAAPPLDARRILLTVGRLDARERYKGHDRVIDAIPQLVAQGHDIAYVIVGEGDDRARLEERARANGISDRVYFAGPVAAEKLPETYRMADLFVMPSTGEGFGIAFLEAMASGTPALGLAFGGACDALADGELGTALADDDLAAAIARLLSAPTPDAQALSAKTRARFGQDVFRERVGLVFDRWFTPA
ncbi:MAG TPA: glycosyltransferase family 4 protein [Stellaceae bacterium]|jgi:phosphatidylinositol alpha-1,6-mannosyltransferase|nr:glycosyltransferase family 4 protein [Stellaceae bacterium]